MRQDWGNPSSKHMKGVEAERIVKEAAKTIADTIGASNREIVFTSGGTESNNYALIGAALAAKRRGNHIITSAFEHPSVYNALLSLEEFGFEIEFAPTDSLGHIDPEVLSSMVRPTTVLVSVMHVNNEVGSLLDIAQLCAAVKEKNKNIIFHCDAIQSYGKIPIDVNALGVDLLSVSGHKIGAPKGSGFLYIRDGVRIRPLLFGGGQQKDRRSGTENVPAIAGLDGAVREYFARRKAGIEKLYGLKLRLANGVKAVSGSSVNAVKSCGEGCYSLDDVKATAPHILSVSFKGVKSEVLLHALEEKGIYVSSGSACSSNHPGISGTLRAIGVDKSLLDSTIRMSFSLDTTEEDIDATIEALKETVPFLARFQRR